MIGACGPPGAAARSVGAQRLCAGPPRTLAHRLRCRAEPQRPQDGPSTSTVESGEANSSQPPQRREEVSAADAGKKVNAFVRSTASTFAPRSSTATKNPAYKGSTLYTVFGAQAWISLVVGGLLSFNVIFPTEQPSIARLLGMWSVWMFTIPALRARECSAAEKDALNLLFLLVPLINVTLPLVWKSFPFIFSADCAALAAVYAWKIGLPGGRQASS